MSADCGSWRSAAYPRLRAGTCGWCCARSPYGGPISLMDSCSRRALRLMTLSVAAPITPGPCCSTKEQARVGTCVGQIKIEILRDSVSRLRGNQQSPSAVRRAGTSRPHCNLAPSAQRQRLSSARSASVKTSVAWGLPLIAASSTRKLKKFSELLTHHSSGGLAALAWHTSPSGLTAYRHA